MAPRSWAQIVATGTTPNPSPLRQEFLVDSQSPSQSPPPPLPSAADFPSLTGYNGDEGQGQNIAASPAGSPSPPSGPISAGEVEEGGVVSSLLRGSDPSSSSPPPITILNRDTTTIAEMVNQKRQEKLAAKKAVAEAARQWLLPEIPAISMVSSSSAAAGAAASAAAIDAANVPLPADEEIKEEKGKGLAIPTEEEATGASSEASAKDGALRRAMIASLERDHRAELLLNRESHNVFLTLKEGTMIGCHRDILTSDAPKLAELLPPADANGGTHLDMRDCTMSYLSPLIFFIYNGELPGNRLSQDDIWDSRPILYNAMFHGPAFRFGVSSLFKFQLDNMLEAYEVYRVALGGRYFYYQVTDFDKLAGFEIPFRMALVHLYLDNPYIDDLKEMKVALAKVATVVLPFLRRQPSFKLIKNLWESLPFPWRSEWEEFYHEGLLPDFPKIFDENMEWAEEKVDESRFYYEEPADAAGPSSRPALSGPANVPFHQESVDEMCRRLSGCGLDPGYPFAR
ncbi:hypothetical protein CORC01_05678 [Colletotrichum orchidophilum]|uniref:BTB domain-containing protein n=1 Tax=Colletotrichum orchidophilum TaxID=1209926 RepID=A0A1G4BC69_9PEZI|nr:uncharacterized protein CORC01_05678 [Colletotrichum orchidophilum]OHE98988.1 hypothetical protein CORC01_05678 [Colletotrichum orchidophilum]